MTEEECVCVCVCVMTKAKARWNCYDSVTLTANKCACGYKRLKEGASGGTREV